jgi:hypothetical protein
MTVAFLEIDTEVGGKQINNVRSVHEGTEIHVGDEDAMLDVVDGQVPGASCHKTLYCMHRAPKTQDQKYNPQPQKPIIVFRSLEVPP